jgi:acyl-coenzyme A synthetase/AMP-(fatty) acid ligase
MAGLPPLADSSDYVAFHAAEHPDAVAMIDSGRAISYAEMSRDLAKFTSAVRELGVERGGRIGIGCEGAYVNWLLLAASERLGIATASYDKDEGAGATAALLSGMDLVLAGPGFGTGAARRSHLVTSEWIDQVLARPGVEVSSAEGEPEDPARIIRTSGTTGASKRMVLKRRMYDAWIERWIWSLGITRQSRYLLTMSFVSTGRHTLTNAVLRAGGTVVAMPMESPAAVVHAIARHAVNLITLLPIQLKQVLDSFPMDVPKPAGLTVATIGAAIADALVEKAVDRLATDVVSYYGSNEIPFIAEMRLPAKDRLMTVFPWVEAEIVDDDGRPLPEGDTGWIRLRSDTMPAGYLDDPETTRRMFRDGWFHPGDVGVLRGRRLQVIGRGDELLNIGGRKLSPAAVEALVVRHLATADVGVCSLANAEAVEEMYVALAGADGDEAELYRRLARAFTGYAYGPVRVVKLARIPRNANGKILRGALRDAVAEAVGARRT